MVDLDLTSSDSEEKQGFPWLIIVAIGVVLALVGAWIVHAKSNQAGSIAALEQLLTAQHAEIDVERQKVFDLSTQLESMKHAIAAGVVADRLNAVDDYNKLAARQRIQREKVKTLVEAYNTNVGKLHDLQ
jgi:hypothetical protein